MDKDKLLKKRIEKLKLEHQHFNYLISQGWHPIDIADQITHHMIKTLYIGIENKFPGISEEKKIEIARKYVDDYNDLKKRGKRNGGD